MNVKLVALISAGLLFMQSLAFANGLSDSWFDQYPQNESFSMNDGTTVALPLHGTFDALLLAGSANFDALAGALRNEGLYPVHLTPNRGMVMLYGIHYVEDSIGPYQELLMLVPVSDHPDAGSGFFGSIGADTSFGLMFAPFLERFLGGALQKTSLYVWQIYVTTESAYQVGREVWGYPKELADISLSAGPGTGASYALQSKNPSLCRLNEEVPDGLFPFHPGIPMKMDFHTITPLTLKRTRPRVIVQAKAQMKLFNRRKDRLDIDPNTVCGSTLNSVEFKPLFWQKLTQGKGVWFH